VILVFSASETIVDELISNTALSLASLRRRCNRARRSTAPGSDGSLLFYEAVRLSENPDAVLLDFLQSTYEVAASLGQWDRETLERRSIEQAWRP